MKSQSEPKARKQLTEARIWLGALTLAVGMFFFGTVGRLCVEGDEFFPTVVGAAGLVSGILLGWGGCHLVSRREDDFGLLLSLSCMGITGFSTSRRGFQTFSEGFLFGLVLALSGILVCRGLLSIVGPVVSRWSKPAQPPRSDHPLYDADIDGAIGPGVLGEKSGRA